MTTYGPDFANIRMPLPGSLDPLHRGNLVQAYKALCQLEVVSIDEDVKRKERRELDKSLLRGMGIHADVVDELYDDLVKMVFNRVKKADSVSKRRS